MSKKRALLLVIVLMMAAIPGCTSYEGDGVTTDFERMLGYVPASVLDEFDIWYIDQLPPKQINRLEDITTMKQLLDLPEERHESVLSFIGETFSGSPRWRIYDLTAFIGFDNMMIDRLVYGQEIGLRSFAIAEASFDETLITDLLTDRGYKETAYGDYSYFSSGDDYYINFRDELSQYVLAAMNRMAVLDNRIFFAPATEYVTGIFDTMSGTVESVVDIPSCYALADSLGDVVAAVFTTPDRVLLDPHEDAVPSYYFDIPSEWELLHQYDMVAMGYRIEGGQRYLDVALHYADTADARADGTELAIRMKSYRIRSQHRELDQFPLTRFMEIGEPQVREYNNGAVLKISNRVFPEGKAGVTPVMGGGSTLRPRDALFLAPDPSIYIADKEVTGIS